jgi:hypothetical protein
VTASDRGRRFQSKPQLEIYRRLDATRARLKALAEVVESQQAVDPTERYWLYEHLRLLSSLARHVRRELERPRLPPPSLADIQAICLPPLQRIYDDLEDYYWDECILELFKDEVSPTLYRNLASLRQDLSALTSALSVLWESRKRRSGHRDRSDSDKEFRSALVDFVGILSNQVRELPELPAKMASERDHDIGTLDQQSG